MASRRFALEHGGPKRLVVMWQGRGDDLKVLLDNCEVPPIKPFASDYRLPDGSLLSITDIGEGNQFEMAILRDGEFLPGTQFDPVHQVQVAYITLFVLAAIHIGFPLLWPGILQELTHGYVRFEGLVVAGIACALIGAGVMRLSRAALIVGVLFVGAEALLVSLLLIGLMLADTKYVRIGIFGIFLLLAVLSGVTQAWNAIGQLKETKASTPIKP